MRFAAAHILLWLWTVPVLVGLLVWGLRRRERALDRFAHRSLIPLIALRSSHQGEKGKIALAVGVFTLSIVALARPQWGFEWQEVKRQGLDIILAVDVSKSMLTQDVRPNRLDRAKLAIEDLLKKLKGDRVGLVAFAGDAFAVCPLTVDYHGFLLSLRDLNVETIPRGGTDVARAIEEAIKEYDQTPSRYKAVVILTDGENLEGDPLAAAKKAREKRIKIYCVGIGTKEGELIRVKNNIGEMQFVKDENGNFVKSRLNEKLLEEIALVTGGSYVLSSGAAMGLDAIYEQELSRFEKREITAKQEKRYHERFQFPLAAALVLLVWETLMPLARQKDEDDA